MKQALFLPVALFLLGSQMLLANQITTSLPLNTADSSYTRAVTEDFTLQGITFSPADTIFVHWNSVSLRFSLRGTAVINIGDGMASIVFGGDTQHQLLISTSNTVQSF
ncbi:MAG: hypothetical protein R3350_10260, partial [Saprospiraceae bacterium]|nr:hypothetical protein [Saprospiraceae bacterium]